MNNKTFEISKPAENSSLFAQAVKSSSEGIVFADTNGNIIYVNKAWQEITGYKSNDVIGKNPRILQSGKTDPHEYTKMWRALKSGKSYFSGNLINKRKNGQLFNTNITIYPTVTINKKRFYVGIYRNVSREIAIEKAKDDLLALASHQLRTPLSIIRWYSEALEKIPKHEFKPKSYKYIKEIGNSSRKMSKLLETLLNISRLELDSFSIEPKNTDIDQLVKDMIDLYKKTAKKKFIRIISQMKNDLGQISVDKDLFDMSVGNLLSNAIRYSNDKSTVYVSVIKTTSIQVIGLKKINKDNLVISIKDNGLGIPKNEQKKIFNKLYRASNIKDQISGGTGLGLYVSKLIIEKTGGQIWFESTINKGSTFYVSYPLNTGMIKKAGTSRLQNY